MRWALVAFVALVLVPSAGWPQGDPLGPEFRVNMYTTDGQAQPSVVVWESSSQDGSGDGVFGQRYNMIVPVELMHFRVE